MAGAKTANKNTRASSSSKVRATSYGDTRFVIPCGGGAAAYIFSPTTGQNPNLRTDSPEFTEAVKATAEAGYADKLRAEFDALAATSTKWAEVRDQLVAANAFAQAA